MFIELIKPLSLLLSLSLLLAFVFYLFRRESLTTKVISGCLYGFMAVLAMMIPFNFMPGFIFDSRSVILSLSGFFGGPVVAALASIIASLYRYSLGGVGVIAGVLVILLCTATGTAYYYIRNHYQIKTKIWHFLVFGAFSHFVAIFGLIVLPDEIMWKVAKNLSIPFFSIYPLATVVLGTIIHNINLNFDRGEDLIKAKDKLQKQSEILQKKIDELTVAKKKTHDIEKRFHQFVLNAPYPVMIHAEGEVIELSTIWSNITGYTREDIPTVKKWTESAYGKDAVPSEKFIDGLYRLEKLQHDGEREITIKDGSTRFWDFSSSPTDRLSDGRRAVITMAVDITERKKAEEVRVKLEEQLRQTHKMEAVGTMAGGIAHDFNNLLAIISGNIDIVQHKQQKGVSTEENIEHIKEAASRAKSLVTQILAFSRQDKHELSLVDLYLVVDDSVRLLRSIIPTTVEIMIVADGESVLIQADATQLQQVLINLCTNAVHAMDEQGLLIVSLGKVELERDDFPRGIDRQPGCYAKLSLGDTGSGIGKEDIDKIFDPFFTTKDVGSGTGMGLSVVHGIVDQHRGYISVDSTINKGTTFNIYLPVQLKCQQEPGRLTEETLPTGTERVLFVDDEESIAEICRELLEYQGYKVTSFTNSIEALNLFKENPKNFDLVFTDQTMPEMSGVALAAQLLKIRPDIPIVLCSGYSGVVSESEAKKVGILEFCMKPMDMKQLALVARKALNERAKAK